MDHSFHIQSGSEKAKGELAEILHSTGANEPGLKKLLGDLEETESKSGNWWIAVDDEQNIRGALTVRYVNDLSYLREVWTRVHHVDDLQKTSHALFDAWLNHSKSGITRFQADLPMLSPLVSGIMESGFQKEKSLLNSYEIETSYLAEEVPEGYIIRPVKRDELDYIYQRLIAPDLDPSSPIYLSPERFRKLTQQLPDQAMEGWTVVENELGKIVGFGASFLTKIQRKSMKDGDEIIDEKIRAVLYGPHSTEKEVIKLIIGEMSSFWRFKSIDKLRIMRVSELYPSLIDHFDMKLISSTSRFIFDS